MRCCVILQGGIRGRDGLGGVGSAQLHAAVVRLAVRINMQGMCAYAVELVWLERGSFPIRRLRLPPFPWDGTC